MVRRAPVARETGLALEPGPTGERKGRLNVSVPEILYLNKQEVLEAGGEDMTKAVNAVEHVFECFARGDAVVPSKTVLRWGGTDSERDKGRINAMPGYLGGRYDLAGIKWIGSHPPNLARNLPRASALIILNDPDTKFPIAVLEGSVISAMRTGAVTGVAAKYLSRTDSVRVGIIGASVQSRTQLMAIQVARPGIREVAVHDLDQERAARFASAMAAQLGLEAFAVATAEEAVRGADIFVTATTASQPIVKEAWAEPGSFYAQVGGYEADVELLLRSDKLVVDNWSEVLHRGLATPCVAIREGRYDEGQLHAELGQIVIGRLPGRENDAERIFFNSVGMGIEDVACSAEVLWEARRLGIGRTLPLWGDGGAT